MMVEDPFSGLEKFSLKRIRNFCASFTTEIITIVTCRQGRRQEEDLEEDDRLEGDISPGGWRMSLGEDGKAAWINL